MKKQWAIGAVVFLLAGMLPGCKRIHEGAAWDGARGNTSITAEAVEAKTDGEGEGQGKTVGDTKAVAGKGPVELVVFAAASLTGPLDVIAQTYEEINPGVDIIYTFDSSGTLKTQIEEGADCDIFISASQTLMDQLDGSADRGANKGGPDWIRQGTRVDLVGNQIVLAVPKGNPAGITSFEDLGSDKLSLVCIGNDDVPAGSYALEVLDHLGLLGQLMSDAKITYGSNVKEVAAQIKEASVDCGIIYATDAFSAGLAVVDEAGQGQCRQITYPAAVIKNSKNPKEAQAFLDYLVTEDCAAVFEAAGFSMAE